MPAAGDSRGISFSAAGSTSPGANGARSASFPKHLTTEKTYKFNAEHQAFHDAVLDYCLGVVEGAGRDQTQPAACILEHLGPHALRRIIALCRAQRTPYSPQRRR